MNKQEIKHVLAKHYKNETIRKLISGRCFPSLNKAIQLEEDGIPVKAWKDIKSYLSDNLSSIEDKNQLQKEN